MRWKYLLMAVCIVASMPACGSSDEDESLIIITNNGDNNGANNGTNNTEPAVRLEALLATTVTTLQDGKSVDITFEVPENTQSVAVTFAGQLPNLYTLDVWKNDDGTPLVNDGWSTADRGQVFQICLGCLQRVTVGEGAFGAMIPGNPMVDVVPGTHTIRVDSFTTTNGLNHIPAVGDVDVFVVAKVAEKLPIMGTLDVNLFFTGSNGWTAEGAEENDELQKMLKDVDQVWSQAGVQLGKVRYYAIDSSYEVIEDAALPGGTDLPEMFALSRNADDQAVNVFFVDELVVNIPGQGGGILLGIAGGIPGPSGTMGTSRSGVAIVNKKNPLAPIDVYKVFAHEVGHFLGLYHTSEQERFGSQIHDELEDTPENDPSLLMHNTGSGDTISEYQGVVMRLNPWVANGGQ